MSFILSCENEIRHFNYFTWRNNCNSYVRCQGTTINRLHRYSNVELFESTNIRNVPRSVHGLGANYRFAREYINRNSLIREATLREASGIRYANVETCPRARCYSFGSRNSGRPLFVSYVPVTRNETLARSVHRFNSCQFAHLRDQRYNAHRIRKCFASSRSRAKLQTSVYTSLSLLFFEFRFARLIYCALVKLYVHFVEMMRDISHIFMSIK